ncbi:hypothetical protein EZS27_044422, partial [termite gut metagenome]
PFEAYSPIREKQVDFQVNLDSIAKYKQAPTYRRLNLRNVAGYSEGQRKDEYVVIGAHYDHVGVDELLVGDKIYNGADDNASSVAVVLQIANAYAASGEKPLRSIIFARDLIHVINSFVWRYFFCFFVGIIKNDTTGHYSMFTQYFSQFAGINARNAGYMLVL